MTGHVGGGGWIEMEVTAPQLVDNKEKTVQVERQVLDANGHMREAVHEGHGQTFTVINCSRPERPRPPD
jgi:hypothetical protein